MEYIFKPITEPNGSQTLYWLMFPMGSIATPTAVLTDYEVRALVQKYCELHNMNEPTFKN